MRRGLPLGVHQVEGSLLDPHAEVSDDDPRRLVGGVAVRLSLVIERRHILDQETGPEGRVFGVPNRLLAAVDRAYWESFYYQPLSTAKADIESQ